MAEIKLKKKHLFFLGIWGVLVTIVLYAYLAYLQPSKFTPFIQSKVQQYVPELSFNNVEFTLFPRLGVEFSGIEYKDELNEYSLDIEARSLLAHMSWISLFKGDFSVAFISFTQPSISLENKSYKQVAENTVDKDKKTIPLSAIKMLELVPSQLRHTQFEVLDGEFYFIPFQEKEQINTYYLGSINLNLDAFEQIDLAVSEFKLVQTSSLDNIAQKHSFSNLMIKLKDIAITEREVTAMLDLQSNISLFDAKVLSLVKTKGLIALNQDFSPRPFEQKLEVNSSFHVKNQEIPSDISFDFQYIDKDLMNISNALLNIEGNILNFSAKLTDLQSDPKAYIETTFNNLSIPRWLSYTRKVPNSIMFELDKLEGSFAAQLDRNSLKTENLKVTTQNKQAVEASVDYNFADGHKLFVDAYLPKLNFNLLFPELDLKKNPEMSYINDTLDSLLHSDSEEEIKFDYNIKVSANDITFYKYNFRSLEFVVKPYEKGVQIPVNMTHFFDGTLSSTINIHDSIDIDTNIKDTSVDMLFEPLTPKSPLLGMLNSNIKISLQTESELEKMLSNPNIDVSASLINGAFNSGETPFTFEKFFAHSKVSKINFPANISDIYGFLGSHSLEFVKNDHNIKVHLPKADLLYNISNGLPDSISSSFAHIEYENNFPVHIISEGMLSFDFPNQHIFYDKFEGSLYDEKLAGSIDFTSFDKPQIKGTSSVDIKNLKTFLKKYRVSTPSLRDKSALSQIRAKNSFTFANNQLSVKDLELTLDDYTFNGSFEYDFTKTKQSVFALSSPFFNADRYIDFASKSNASPFSSDKALNLDFITKIDTVGSFTFEELWIMRTPFYKANIPMQFAKGAISITPTAVFPTSGSIAANAKFIASPTTLEYDMQAKAKDVDMLAITQAQGLETLLAGNGTFTLNAKGRASKESDIFRNMQGDFSLWIEHGFFINSTAKEKVTNFKFPPQQSPYVPKNLKTSFSLISASAPIRNGVLKIDNINMSGQPIGFVGQSTVDLNKWTISLAALASYANTAKIPISVNGSLSDPELSVKLFGSLTQTFASLTKSLVNTLTDIIKKPLDMIQ